MKTHDLAIPYWRCDFCLSVVTAMRWKHRYDEEDWIKFVRIGRTSELD